MKQTVTRYLSLLALGLIAPFAASAHVKWFVETEEILEQPATAFSISDTAVLIGITIIIAILIFAFILERKIPEPSIYFRRAIKRNKAKLIWFFQLLVGLGLILGAVNGSIIAEPFHVEGNWLATLQVTQAIIGALFILNIFVIAASWVLIILYITVAVQFGWLPLFEHLLIVGIAVYLLFERANTKEKEEKKKWDPYRKYGLPLLRITTGLSLVFLAFQEKLFHPELSLAFLQEHQLNFMQALGMEWFTNELFVLAAGMSELLFGLLLVSGLITRTTTIALAIIFIITAIVLGPNEVIGHLPIFGIAFILILYGAGKALALRTPPKI